MVTLSPPWHFIFKFNTWYLQGGKSRTSQHWFLRAGHRPFYLLITSHFFMSRKFIPVTSWPYVWSRLYFPLEAFYSQAASLWSSPHLSFLKLPVFSLPFPYFPFSEMPARFCPLHQVRFQQLNLSSASLGLCFGLSSLFISLTSPLICTVSFKKSNINSI